MTHRLHPQFDEDAEYAAMLDIAVDLFHHWAWQTGQSESDPTFDEDRWIKRAREVSALQSGVTGGQRAASVHVKRKAA